MGQISLSKMTPLLLIQELGSAIRCCSLMEMAYTDLSVKAAVTLPSLLQLLHEAVLPLTSSTACCFSSRWKDVGDAVACFTALLEDLFHKQRIYQHGMPNTSSL